jgi:hypothetical protein
MMRLKHISSRPGVTNITLLSLSNLMISIPNYHMNGYRLRKIKIKIAIWPAKVIKSIMDKLTHQSEI